MARSQKVKEPKGTGGSRGHSYLLFRPPIQPTKTTITSVTTIAIRLIGNKEPSAIPWLILSRSGHRLRIAIIQITQFVVRGDASMIRMIQSHEVNSPQS